MRLFILYIISFIITFSYSAEISLEQFIEQLIKTNPSLLATKQQIQAMQDTLQNSGALQDPSLSFESGQNQIFKLNQKAKNFERASLERKVASIDVELAEVRLRLVQRILTSQAKSIYFNLYALDKIIKLTEEELAVLGQMYVSSLKQYESNRVSAQDPLNMSIMQTEVAIRLEKLQQERLDLLAEATRLLGGTEVSFSFPAKLLPTPLKSKLNILQDLAVSQGNFEVLMAVKETEKANYSKVMVSVENLSDYEFGMNYVANMSSIELMAGISLPLWVNKNATNVHFQESLSIIASSNLKDIVQRVKAEVATIYYKIMSADRILPLYDLDIIPKSKQARNLAKSAYEAGRLDFNSWVLAEQRYITMSVDYYRTLAGRMIDESELCRLMGTRR